MQDSPSEEKQRMLLRRPPPPRSEETGGADGGGGGGQGSGSTRESIKAISRSIVQRRTQMFEQGGVGDDDGGGGGGGDANHNDSSEHVEVSVESPRNSGGSAAVHGYGGQQPAAAAEIATSPVPGGRESPLREQHSPQHGSSRDSVRSSPNSSPKHEAKVKKSGSPKHRSPVRSPKPSTGTCQPKIILGAAPKPVETPVKPPRSKKSSVKLKGEPPTPPATDKPMTPDFPSSEKPTPVRKAPDIPSLVAPKPAPREKPVSPSLTAAVKRPAEVGGDPAKVTAEEGSEARGQRVEDAPVTPVRTEDAPLPRPQKPSLPEKPSDILKVKPHKPARPARSDVLSSKPPPPRAADQPEWLKRRHEVMRARSVPVPVNGAETPTQGEEEEAAGQGGMPHYAAVDKVKKQQDRASKAAAAAAAAAATTTAAAGGKEGGSGEEGTEEASVTGEDGKPNAPPKPPRTFAHDVYLKKKAEKREKRLASRSSTGGDGGEAGADHSGGGGGGGSDEPDRGRTDASPRPVPTPTKRNSAGEADRPQSESLYEEIGGGGSADGNRIRKPAPPPRPKAAPQRPPAPAVLRVREDQSSVVNVVRHNKKIPEEGFIKSGRRKISNPSYDRHVDIIPIKTYRDQATGALRRHKSDEYLYADPQALMSRAPAAGRLPPDSPAVGGGSGGGGRSPAGGGRGVRGGGGTTRGGGGGRGSGRPTNRPPSASSVDDNPIYQEPADATAPRAKSCVTAHGVSLDEEGYAIPDMPRNTLGRRQKFRSPSFNIKGVQKWGTIDRTKFGKFANHDFRSSLTRKKLPSVREKMSQAYSILHKHTPTTPEGQAPLESTTEEDEDSQVDIEEHKKRLAYISSIKEKQHAKMEYVEMSSRSHAHLFDYSLVVGLEKNTDSNTYRPHIIYKYPDQLPSEVETIAEFCFPDAEQWRPVTQAQTEDFFFVLTSGDGSRQYGYCRRLLPPGSQNRLPEVYCCVSSLSALGFYQQLLAELDKLRKLSPDLPFHLIKAAYAHPIPAPGRESWISCPVNDGKKETVILKRNDDSRLEKVSFEALFKHLHVDTILKVFSAVLLERRILFTAQHLSTLSSCISALTVILYPFSWQHTFVPVLPVSMIDVCCAPTPYILGVLSTALPKLQRLELEEVLIVDLDTNSLVASAGDEHAILPKKLQKCLRTALTDDIDMSGVARDTVIFEAFLRLFVETTGHYTEFINTQQDGELVFQKELFTKAVSSKSIRLFLEWFVETQMFEVFITEKLQEGISSTGLFEERIEEYRDEMEQMSLSIKDNVKQFGRRMINLVSEAGGKLKKALGGERNVYV